MTVILLEMGLQLFPDSFISFLTRNPTPLQCMVSLPLYQILSASWVTASPNPVKCVSTSPSMCHLHQVSALNVSLLSNILCSNYCNCPVHSELFYIHNVTLQSHRLQKMHSGIHRYATVVSLVCIYLSVQCLIYMVSSCISMQMCVKCVNMWPECVRIAILCNCSAVDA